MNIYGESMLNIPDEVFRHESIYVLLSIDEGEWIERSVSDFYIIKDNTDLLAAMTLKLEQYGFILLNNNSFKFEQNGQSGFSIHIDFKEKLFPDRKGSITFNLFSVKNAKEFMMLQKQDPERSVARDDDQGTEP